MAFNRDGLRLLVNGAGVWEYKTLDALATVRVVGYFNSAARELAIGDYIIIKVVTGSVKAPTGITAVATTYVNSMAAGAVDVVDPVSHASTDTD